MSGGDIEVRSYRRVFRLERRLYRVDRFVLPLPGGLPLRGFVYFLTALAGLLVVQSLPGVGWLLALLPVPVRLLLVPAALALCATQATPDGRPAHRFAAAWLAYRLRPRRTVDGRGVPAPGERISVGAAIAFDSGALPPQRRPPRIRLKARRAVSAPGR